MHARSPPLPTRHSAPSQPSPSSASKASTAGSIAYDRLLSSTTVHHRGLQLLCQALPTAANPVHDWPCAQRAIFSPSVCSATSSTALTAVTRTNHKHPASDRNSWQQPRGSVGAPTTLSTTHAAVAAPHSSAASEPLEHLTQDASSTIRATAHQQSLEVLEWLGVCKQVACFCGTSMAAELLQAGQLPIGNSRAESVLLSQQTAEALRAGLEVAGVFDLHPALEAAASGGILNGRQLEGVASSMESAFALRAAAAAAVAEPSQQQQLQQQEYLYPTLAQLAAGIQNRELRTLQAIRSCISDGGVLSEATPELADVRAARYANKDKARERATQIARELYAQGAAEGREPLLQRGRYCVALKRNRRSAVSKGSVKLGQSSTGATLYMEPSELLDLNNREAQLADEETQAELAVLQGLSQFVGERAAAIQGMLTAVTQLDIVAARAKHARWCQGLRPAFIDDHSSGSDSSSTGLPPGTAAPSPSPLRIPGAQHPLLLQPSLPPLPRPPSIDDASFETDFIPPPLFAFAAATSSSDSDTGSKQQSDGASTSLPGTARTAQPLDVSVPASARVVAITGPNTGGKTVTLKTAGLLALMAKAGLYLPCDRKMLAAEAAAGGSGRVDGEPASSSGSGSSDDTTPYQPSLLWFDQVLADIGDSQSLQQNLSTFSGHIQRLKLLIAAAGPHSLVLLDEVGSGTDPLEGSALARAVLDVLAGKACLTLATSHHAELKQAAEEDRRYVNVSLEFNTLTLQPTYRLLWGSAGSSNALDIATALGFDARVVADARALVHAELGRQEQQKGRMEQVAASVEDQLSTTRASTAALHAEREKREKDVEQLQEAFRQMLTIRAQLRAKEQLVKREAAEMVIKVQQASLRCRQGPGSLPEVQAIIDSYASILRSSPHSTGEGSIKPGDMVFVPSMGTVNPFIAPVVKVSGDTVWLEGSSNPFWRRRQAGLLKFRVDQVVLASLLQLPAASTDDNVA